MNVDICKQCKNFIENKVLHFDKAASAYVHIESDWCCYLRWDEKPEGSEVVYLQKMGDGSIIKNTSFVMPDACPYHLEHLLECQQP